MDLIYAEESASARHIWDQLPDQPSYGTVRKLLQILVNKGHLKQRLEGKTMIYTPVESRRKAAASALKRLVNTFYGGSIEDTMSGLLNLKDHKLTKEELNRLSEQIKQARKESKP